MLMATSNKYPYPSQLNVGNFVSIKLTQTNYLLWKTQMLGLIESQNLVGFIDGEYPQPDQQILSSDGKSQETNPEYVRWRNSDRLLRGWITGTLSEEILGHAVGLETSAAVWKALENAFAQSSQAREFQLEAEISLLQKGDMSLTHYLSKFKRLCDDLVAIGKPISDEKKVFCLLKGLGPNYDSFTTSMLKPPIPSYTDLIPLLQSHEAIKQAHVPHHYTHPKQTEAFVGQRFSEGNGCAGANRSNNRQFTSNGRGFIQTGHNPSRHGTNFRPNNGGQSQDRQSQPKHQVRNSTEFPKPTQKGGTQITCQICDKPGHGALKCWNRFNHAFKP